MAEHYSGHDPERGCGLILIAIIVALVLTVIGLYAYVVWS